ncbi:MAG: response regulator transcription factor [Oscillospiraceae bacterium]|nr:response regulator transcription factor [Oscillospiraceae bacterium]
MTRILLVEDEPSIVGSLSEFLASEGFSTDHADGMKSAMEKLAAGGFHLVLLDVSLAEGNGFSVCSAIKGQYDIPVIFLTASGDEASIVAGLDLGADDYVAKPFRPRELVSRIRSALRRYGSSSVIALPGQVTVDADRGAVTKAGAEVPLSALEYRILLLFASNRGRLLTRERLLEDIWDIAGDFVNDNTLTVYIKRIREKIEDDPAHPEIIRTVRGLGYRVD